MGRINFGPKLVNDRKGIVGNVALDGKTVEPWSMFRLPLNDLTGLKFSRGSKPGAAFYRGEFQLLETGDTFFDMRGCGKGIVWVNGHNLGRHWKIAIRN